MKRVGKITHHSDAAVASHGVITGGEVIYRSGRSIADFLEAGLVSGLDWAVFDEDGPSYADLAGDLIARLPSGAAEWTDHDTHSSGAILLDLFADLAEPIPLETDPIPLPDLFL